MLKIVPSNQFKKDLREDWKGYTLPGGHIETGESIVDAIVREIKVEIIFYIPLFFPLSGFVMPYGNI